MCVCLYSTLPHNASVKVIITLPCLSHISLFGLLIMEVLSNKIQLPLLASPSSFWGELKPGINMPLLEEKSMEYKILR